MKSIPTSLLFVFLILCSPALISGQNIQLDDPFDDGDFTNNPTWDGTGSSFTIFEDSGNNQLQLNATDAGSSYLSTSSATAYGSWEFFIHLDFTTLSGSNNLTVFLTSNMADLFGEVSGYALQAGESGSGDVFTIVRYEDGSVVETVVTGTTNINDGGEFQVKAERSPDGTWILSVAEGYGSTPVQEATGADNEYNSSFYFGFRPEYTSTRTDLFYFDDIVITQAPIELTAMETVSNQEFQVTFTNELDAATVDPSDFSIDGIGNPEVISVYKNQVTLTFTSSIPGGNYILTVNNLSDQAGNPLPANSSLSFSIFDQYTNGDVVINEFMYDEPAGQAEYIEIRNLTSKRLDISNWQLGDSNEPQSISSDSLILEGDAFLVLTADSTNLFNSYGNRNYWEIKNFPTLNNSSGDQIRIHTGAGIVVDSLFYDPSWGGEDRALERRLATAPSVYRENWGNSPNKSGGTPGMANEITEDTTAPHIIDYEITTNQSMVLFFSERLEAGSATHISNYGMNDISINNARLTDPDSVELSFETPLQNNTHYSLTIAGVEDIFGNTISSESISFTHYEISKADSGDIVINEFMYDPPPGPTEYIELYNSTERSFDLQGSTLNDNTGRTKVLTNQQFILPPDSFAVIAPDSTLFKSFPGINLLAMGNRFPSLNNGGDEIIIRKSNGTLIDSLQYRSSWGGNEVSLERRSSSVAGIYRENWMDASKSPGSPGQQNTATPDQTPPKLTSFTIINASQLQLVFSERIKNPAALQAKNYALTPSIDIQLISAQRDTVKLYLAEKLISGTNYQISVRNLRDVFGNIMESTSLTREYLEISPAGPGDVVINEILYQRAGATAPEFVELYNRSSENFNLANWQLGDGTDLIDIGQLIQLKAGQYILLTGNEKLASTKANGHYLPGFPSLNDNEEAVYIRSDRQVTIDSLYYYSRWGGSDGISIERKDPLAASNDASNWTTSESQDGASAGNINGSYSPDESPPGILFSSRKTDGLIEVRFTEFIQISESLVFTLDGSALPVEQFVPSRGNRIWLNTPSGKQKKGKSATISIQNLTDVKGNITPSASIPIAESVTPGSVVINEIMYNPLSESEDNQPDQSEYIELRNTRDYAISLEGFSLHDAPDENDEIQTLVPVSSTSTYLPANGHLLIHADEALDFSESQTAEFFELSGLDPNRTVRIDRGTLSLASQNDAIYLADSTGATIDSVYYDESWQNPNIVDTRGVALERINPNGPSSDASNWSSSTTDKGGTPGSENSIYQIPGTQPEEIGISFTPNPFSPDDDGYEDHLFINYTLDQPDYLLKVRIFDRYGRLVRELVDGEQAGYEGSLQWDGLTDSGNRNRIGIFVVLFEAYDSSNGSDRTFKEVVVLARQL